MAEKWDPVPGPLGPPLPPLPPGTLGALWNPQDLSQPPGPIGTPRTPWFNYKNWFEKIGYHFLLKEEYFKKTCLETF